MSKMIQYKLVGEDGSLQTGMVVSKADLPSGAEVVPEGTSLDSLMEENNAQASVKANAELERADKELAIAMAALPTKVVITVPVNGLVREIQGEEASSLKANSAQFSYGNGATGYMGIPVKAGSYITDIYFAADTYPSTAKVEVSLMNYGIVASNAKDNIVTTIKLENARDGGGDTNNAYKYITLDKPIKVMGKEGSNATLLGFACTAVSGAVSDVRVGCLLQQP